MKRIAFSFWFVSGWGYEVFLLALTVWGLVWAYRNPDRAIKAGLLASVASGLTITFWGLS